MQLIKSPVTAGMTLNISPLTWSGVYIRPGELSPTQTWNTRIINTRWFSKGRCVLVSHPYVEIRGVLRFRERDTVTAKHCSDLWHGGPIIRALLNTQECNVYASRHLYRMALGNQWCIHKFKTQSIFPQLPRLQKVWLQKHNVFSSDKKTKLVHPKNLKHVNRLIIRNHHTSKNLSVSLTNTSCIDIHIYFFKTVKVSKFCIASNFSVSLTSLKHIFLILSNLYYSMLRQFLRLLFTQ